MLPTQTTIGTQLHRTEKASCLGWCLLPRRAALAGAECWHGTPEQRLAPHRILTPCSHATQVYPTVVIGGIEHPRACAVDIRAGGRLRERNLPRQDRRYHPHPTSGTWWQSTHSRPQMLCSTTMRSHCHHPLTMSRPALHRVGLPSWSCLPACSPHVGMFFTCKATVMCW